MICLDDAGWFCDYDEYILFSNLEQARKERLATPPDTFGPNPH
jgi:hypothetical protein